MAFSSIDGPDGSSKRGDVQIYEQEYEPQTNQIFVNADISGNDASFNNIKLLGNLSGNDASFNNVELRGDMNGNNVTLKKINLDGGYILNELTPIKSTNFSLSTPYKEEFGKSLSIDGNYAIVGANQHTTSNNVYSVRYIFLKKIITDFGQKKRVF